MSKLYDIEVKTRGNAKIKMDRYKGNVILIVNTASKCGFTPQFDGLEELYKKYKDDGLVIIGFPSNDFRQELKSNKDAYEYCKLNYGVTFPMMGQVHVRKKNQDEIFNYLVNEKRRGIIKHVKWNFEKFLIDSNGKLIKRYGSQKSPMSIEKDIIKLLEVNNGN